MTHVVDASVAVTACLAADGFSTLPDDDLVAPGLMWSEARSALHVLVWRGALEPAKGESAHETLASCPVRAVERADLGLEAWRIATDLGWAKTYDAEYIALARLLDCRLITLDGRLHRGAAGLGLVVAPDELD